MKNINQHKATRLESRKVVPFAASVAAGFFIGCQTLMAPSISSVYAKLSPSVVTVSTKELVQDPFSPGSLVEKRQGEGTGFVMGKYIVTNAHVVKDSHIIAIIEKNGAEHTMAITGVDPKHDVALLEFKEVDGAGGEAEAEIRAEPMKPLKVCEDEPEIGESVIAIGSPFGLSQTLTSGIISGIERSIGTPEGSTYPLVNLYQTDAAINPGNSGGPLISVKNQCVLGMNTALLSPTGANVGIGLAVPVKVVDRVVNEIVQDNPRKAFQFGITLLPDSFSELFGVQGAIVANTIKGGIARGLDIQGTYRDDGGRPMIGDIIVGINGKRIKTNLDVYAAFDAVQSGDLVTISILRSGMMFDIHIIAMM